MKVVPGTVFRIPLKNDCFALARVEYVSRRYKNTMQCGLYDHVFRPTEVVTDFSNYPILKTFFTSTVILKQGYWEKEKGLEADVEGIDLHATCAGRVVLNDEDMGAASTSDLETLPQLNSAGKGFVEIMCNDVLFNRRQ